MNNTPGHHHRRSIRLKGYDYSQAGAYFVTVCTQNRACLLGNVVDGKTVLNDAGQMVEKWYRELENKYPFIIRDKFICMPNHIHFIVINVGADLCVRPDSGQTGVAHDQTGVAHDQTGVPRQMGAHIGAPLPAIVQWYKTMTTNAYIRGVKQHGWPPFAGKLWQRNYYEQIVRHDDQSNRIREYIVNNPKQWGFDRENPAGEFNDTGSNSE